MKDGLDWSHVTNLRAPPVTLNSVISFGGGNHLCDFTTHITSDSPNGCHHDATLNYKIIVKGHQRQPQRHARREPRLPNSNSRQEGNHIGRKHDISGELAIILPSLDPDKKLCGVIDGLIAEGFEHIVIVKTTAATRRIRLRLSTPPASPVPFCGTRSARARAAA